MIYRIEARTFGDTAAISAAQAKGCVAVHLGFGNFKVTTPGGTVYFDRTCWLEVPVTWPGMSGRAHLLSGPGVGWLIDNLEVIDGNV